MFQWVIKEIGDCNLSLFDNFVVYVFPLLLIGLILTYFVHCMDREVRLRGSARCQGYK